MGNDIREKLKSDDVVKSVSFDEDECHLHVSHELVCDEAGSKPFRWSDKEVELIRDGKLTPLTTNGDATVYDCHITIEQQEKRRASKFSFTE